jgi:hypothetical protein
MSGWNVFEPEVEKQFVDVDGDDPGRQDMRAQSLYMNGNAFLRHQRTAGEVVERRRVLFSRAPFGQRGFA